MLADIDYMDMYKDFTVSTKIFKKLPELVKSWNASSSVHLVTIIDATVDYEPDSNDSSYKRGLKAGCFIQDPNNPSNPFVGKEWPGLAV